MPNAARVSDKSNCENDSHGNICCPHNVTGPAINGSPNVYINTLKALRLNDSGVHSACCGPNTWNCSQGSSTVYINGLPAIRKGDKTTHCGGIGNIISGSEDVFIGG